jgi:hypothetical protein
MRKVITIIGLLFLTISFNSQSINAETPPKLTPECIEKGKERDEEYNKRIMDDIISSFKLDIDESGYAEFSNYDLMNANLMYGGKEDDTYYNSLNQLFESIGSTFGHARVFIRPLNGYFLYKETDNTNVMVKLKLENEKWVVVEKKEKSGKPIEYNKLKCEEEYLKKRNKYHNIK